MFLFLSSVLFLMFVMVRTECPANLCFITDTCCPRTNPGMYGCCPLPGAVCCPDKNHCCPARTICDAATGKCRRKLSPLIPSNKVIDVLAETTVVKDIQCDSERFCNNNQTCCPLSNGRWGCCNWGHAVCCNDNLHCCPKNTKCNLSTGWCMI